MNALRNAAGLSLIDVCVGLALSAWLITGGLMALRHTQLASDRLRGLGEWARTDVLARHTVRQRIQRSGAPLPKRLAPGHWQLHTAWPALGTDDASKGPWRFAHWSFHTPLNCQGGRVQEATPSTLFIDAYSLSAPDRLLCQNPLHEGNLRQTLWAGIKGWTLQAAVQVSPNPALWQWQTLSPAHTGADIAALRVCWRTVPEHLQLFLATASPNVGLSNPSSNTAEAWSCSLPLTQGVQRDRWQLIARWHGKSPPS